MCHPLNLHLFVCARTHVHMFMLVKECHCVPVEVQEQCVAVVFSSSTMQVQGTELMWSWLVARALPTE